MFTSYNTWRSEWYDANITNDVHKNVCSIYWIDVISVFPLVFPQRDYICCRIGVYPKYFLGTVIHLKLLKVFQLYRGRQIQHSFCVLILYGAVAQQWMCLKTITCCLHYYACSNEKPFYWNSDTNDSEFVNNLEERFPCYL